MNPIFNKIKTSHSKINYLRKNNHAWKQSLSKQSSNDYARPDVNNNEEHRKEIWQKKAGVT